MNSSPHTKSSHSFQTQNMDRKRTSSLINQLCSASRQNLQVINRHNINNQNLGFQKINRYTSNRQINENYSKIDAYTYPQRVQIHEVTKLKTQNSSLKQQIQRQKQRYQLEISQLRKNLTLKDDLLDECEKQIVNLKSKYLKLIDQYQKFRGSEDSHRKINKQSFDFGQKTNIIPRSPEGSFLPLSIKSKSHTSGEIGKLSHGLIKGRV